MTIPDALEFNPLKIPTSLRMSTAESPSEYLFSYGTLQTESVQLATFGRRLEGKPDALPGFTQSMVRVEDPAVVQTSGEALHPIIAFTGDNADLVTGTVFAVSAEELHRADAYEVAAYRRVSVILRSGTRAWVYVDVHHAPPDS